MTKVFSYKLKLSNFLKIQSSKKRVGQGWPVSLEYFWNYKTFFYFGQFLQEIGKSTRKKKRHFLKTPGEQDKFFQSNHEIPRWHVKFSLQDSCKILSRSCKAGFYPWRCLARCCKKSRTLLVSCRQWICFNNLVRFLQETQCLQEVIKYLQSRQEI